MSISRFAPGTVCLVGPRVTVNDLAASEAITPGQLVEMFTLAGVTRFRKSTLTGLANRSFLKDHPMANAGIDTAVAAGDLVDVGIASAGDVIYGFVASGTTITKGDPLSDNGNGSFKPASGITIARALDTVNNSAGVTPARLRIEFV